MMKVLSAHLPTPALELREDTPVSAAFDDVYFSRAGGVAETEHVFLKGNGLPQRWQLINEGGLTPYATASLTPAASGSAGPTHGQTSGVEFVADAPFNRYNFTIAELGFGTGLNFLTTLRRFRETAPDGLLLHYHAVEAYPFTHAVLKQLLALHPELADEAAELLAHYPLRLPGPHRIHLPRVVLTLWFGEVDEWLEELSAGGLGERSALREPRAAGVRSVSDVGGKAPYNEVKVDAWYLDGFSPAKNPDMWREEVFAGMAAASAPQASFATFTSAGHVRRGLEAAGFTVEKMAGFGSKREMSVGRLNAGGGVVSYPADSDVRVLVIGGGIAGATLARALAERGKYVTLVERGSVAGAASGNAAGVLFPPLTKQWTVAAAFYFSAYDYTLRALMRWQSQGLKFTSNTIGMLRLPRHDEEAAQLATLNETLGIDEAIVHWLPQDAASEKAGVKLPSGAAYFPQGTWISPPELCRTLLQHERIMLREHMAVSVISETGDGWHVSLANGETLHTKTVCVASAADSAELLANYGLRLQEVGGQVSEFAAADVAAPLRSILCRKGYLIPRGDAYLTGATYHREDFFAVTEERHAENIEELRAVLPGWFKGQVTTGRSSARATTPDRLPYIGRLDEGLYVSAGHGSRGMLSAPLAAEMIASMMLNEAAPVSGALMAAVRPSRFIRRA
jgi:tRNA 5-methylaminomethyl-2-thiouridine biosynthesis bifunctional protein